MFLPKLEQARKELLDLSGRNRLTHFHRPTPKRGGISIVDELAEQVYQILVEDGKTMTFLATTENTTGRPTPLLPLLDASPVDAQLLEGLPERYTDTKLQTLLNLEDLDRRLRRMYTTARTFVEEQGINVLYLAIGVLQWFESETSQEKREAPLVLIPVELYRDNVRTRYKLRYTGDDIGTNISLQERLWREFNIQLPPGPEAEEFDVLSYFDSVAQAVSSRPRWSVDRSAIVLDFFRFSKLQMYKDLAADSWNGVLGVDEHPVLSKLLGTFTFLIETVGYTDFDATSSSRREPEIDTKHLVVDADSSQVKAIQAAMSGKNLVIQGPPGTGKSQTITNIIAEAIGQGKTVLFVAEKMAALEVVKRRLDKLGLGDACLELHSHKANKKAFLAELERTLSLPEPRLPTEEYQLRALQEERDYLDLYCRVVNSETGETQVTPYQAYGLYLLADKRLADTLPPKLELPDSTGWKEADFQYLLETVDRFQSLLRQIGQPKHHPFWGSQRRLYLPADQQALRDAAIKAERCVSQLSLDADRGAELIGASPATSTIDAESLLRLIELAIIAPRIAGITLTAPEWEDEFEIILSALEQAEQYYKQRERFQEYLIPEAWKENLLPVRKAIVTHGGRVSRFWSRDYRQAQKLLRSISRRDLPSVVTEQVALVDAVLEVQRLHPSCEANRPLLQKVFAQLWRDKDTQWSVLRQIALWIKQVQTSGLDARQAELLLKYVYGDPPKDKIRELEFDLRRSLADYRSAIDSVIQIVQLDEHTRFGADQKLVTLPFLDQLHLLHDWALRAEKLQEMVSFNSLKENLYAQKFGPVVDVSTEWEYALSRLVDLVKRTRYEKLIERAMQEQPLLADFSGATHQHRINRFRELDHYLLSYNRVTILHQHWRHLPKQHASGVALLREQFNRKRGHKSIRILIGETGKAIQAIKPVFMMSPFSIATFLPPGSVQFDLVVFDEASQVKPVDAFGAILRGNQTIVVGDDKQLPPTNFFDSTINDQTEDDDSAADTESILGLFRAKAASHEMLLWHYRSRHESLIAVSNHEFYGNRLIIFPSPDKERRELGLVFHHLPQTTYTPRSDGVSGGRNHGEAQAVANAVMEHARNHAAQSLLVATFNQQQRELIDEHIERLRKADTSCEHFFRAHPEEPFEVKNLENVQGDERDVIFISIGFGKDKDNKISMNFGPLNKDGGERRLNVLITRARDRCEVFTNLTADDIDLSRTQAKGVRALKRFLKYAKTGILDVPETTGSGTESPFEQAVVEALHEAGYQVATQVGTGGYRIDIAIIDDDQPGRYLLGIECDGATYHRSQSARDRDRLRQEVLEAMGWQIHRIWSTDWFRNPQRELQRIKESVEAARARLSVRTASNVQATQQSSAPHLEDRAVPLQTQHLVRHASMSQVAQQSSSQSPKVNEQHRKSQPTILPSLVQYKIAQAKFRIGKDNFQETSVGKLAEEISRIVGIESPIHVDVLLQRIATGTIKEVRERIEFAIDEAVSKKMVLRSKNDFLFRPNSSKTIVRDRSSLNDIARNIEYIHYNELAQAVHILVKHMSDIATENLGWETLRFLGYTQITGKMTERMDAIIAAMFKQGYLKLEDNVVKIVSK